MTGNVLLVEGIDDVHVVRHLLQRHGYSAVNLDIRHMGGFDAGKWRAAISALLLSDQTQALGLLVDADENPQSRWQSLQTIVQHLPLQPHRGGFIARRSRRGLALVRIGIWIMPDNCNPGNLEHFLREMIPPGDRLWPYAQQCVAGLPERRFAQADELKAEVHTWLAWQKKPGRPYGTAIEAGYLNAFSPLASAFVDWLVNLFRLS